MKSTAIVFEGVRQVGLGEIDLPPAAEQDLVVETLVSGISVGTERWALIGSRGEMKFPHVPGYLSVGRVVQAGRDHAQGAQGTSGLMPPSARSRGVN